jgi:hypothetical protein
MKTRQRDSSGTPGLPPAPAPPSRDANPWSMSGQGDDAPKLHARVREAVRKAGDKSGPPVAERAPSAGGQKLAWLPYLMLVFVVVTSLRVAIEAFGAGHVEAAIGPLLAILFAAFFVWRRMRRKH